jgi:hypothetical protein
MTWINNLIVGIYASYHGKLDSKSLGNVGLKFASVAASVSRYLHQATSMG